MHFHIPYEGYRDKYPTKLLSLYHSIRDSIVDAVLPYRTKLPSSRELAGLYGVSRGTVNQVYEMLAAEGYVVSEIGRGTFISYRTKEMKREDPLEAAYTLSEWGQRVESHSYPRAAGIPAHSDEGMRRIDFHMFAPDLAWFPQEEWNRCLYAQARKLSMAEGRAYGSLVQAQGDEALREGIAQYLRRARGIAVDAGQIIVVSGSMQAIAFAVQLLVNKGEHVIVENPGFLGIQRAVQSVGGTCILADVDEYGMVLDVWDARLLFVTPGRQFPTGSVLSMERRQQLLGWAYEKGAIIVEDDYDSEFRHRGKPLEPLKVLDRHERVIHIGSFSKTLLPSVRIGYAVVPQALTSAFVKAKALYELLPTGLLEQRTLAAFMASGQYEKHLRRMKRVYGRKFECLQQLLGESLSGLFDWVESDAGLHLFGWWKGTEEQYVRYRERCLAAGIRWSDTEVDDAGGRRRYGVIFHFPHLSEPDMAYGIARMKEAALTIE